MKLRLEITVAPEQIAELKRMWDAQFAGLPDAPTLLVEGMDRALASGGPCPYCGGDRSNPDEPCCSRERTERLLHLSYLEECRKRAEGGR